VVRYSFLVRLFHPLLQAGLSRRTEMAMLQQQPAGMASERPPAMPELLESLRNDERGDLTLIA
jgi:hypothetical protein